MSQALRVPPGPGCAIESATSHVEILVCDAAGAARALEAEEVGFGHARRLAPLLAAALERAGTAARDLAWVAADLGPGSFTGVRVGLATAEALALAAGATRVGASSLAGLAHGAGARRALLVPLVPAGRRDLYAGFFRADPRGRVTLLAAPRVGEPAALLAAVAEVRGVVEGAPVRFVGPGVARERAHLEEAHPGSTTPEWRLGGLSAHDLAAAALGRLPGGAAPGPAAGLPAPGESLRPLYVRSAQAEERVRRGVFAELPIRLRGFVRDDIPEVAVIERRVFADPWSEGFFRSELQQAMVYARIAEQEGRIAGYLVAWLGAGAGHIGNLAVIPEARRRGVARALIADLLARAHTSGATAVTLEVRVSNFAAQALYRAHGFRLAGLRPRYYRETGEDALIMEWRAPAAAPDPAWQSPGGGRAAMHPES